MKDYKSPDWNNLDRVHEWKNYISEDLVMIWDTFTDIQKKVIAENADNIADREEWD